MFGLPHIIHVCAGRVDFSHPFWWKGEDRGQQSADTKFYSFTWRHYCQFTYFYIHMKSNKGLSGYHWSKAKCPIGAPPRLYSTVLLNYSKNMMSEGVCKWQCLDEAKSYIIIWNYRKRIPEIKFATYMHVMFMSWRLFSKLGERQFQSPDFPRYLQDWQSCIPNPSGHHIH